MKGHNDRTFCSSSLDFQPDTDYPPGFCAVAKAEDGCEYDEALVNSAEAEFSSQQQVTTESATASTTTAPSGCTANAATRPSLARRQGIISMREMLIKCYGQELMQRLADSINSGDTELLEQGCFTADTANMQITDVFFTRTSLYSVYADVYCKASLLSQDTPWVSWLTKKFRCGMSIDMFEDEPEEVDFYDSCLANHCHHRVEGVPLDDYWVPYYKAEDIEKASENILWVNCPHMLEDPSAINAHELAAALGLNIIHLPLYKKKQTASILFFTAGVVTLRDEDGEPYTQHVDGKTIVLNDYYVDRPQASQTAIFHECFHYTEHYIFFRGQSMCNNDLSLFAPWKDKNQNDSTSVEQDSMSAEPANTGLGRKKKHNQANPIRVLEWQANRASYCMMMPKSLLAPRLSKGLEKLSGTGYHLGKKLDIVCRNLAEEFSAPKYCARYRAINMGYIAAKGALNYVGDRYIEPFAFSHDSCRGDYSFVVSAKDVVHEYISNAEFRELLDKGHYVYVDGHMCVNDEQFVVKSEYGCRLTRYANANVDKCCLRFQINYIVDADDGYVYGQLRSDAEYNERYLTYDRITENMSIFQRTTLYTEIIASLSKQAHKAIVEHMIRLEITTEQMAERCEVHESTIKRIRRGDKKTFTLDQIVIICIAIHLPPELSDDLVARSKNFFLTQPEDDTKEARELFTLHMIYRVLLRSFYLLPLREIQKKLAAEHQLMLEFSKVSMSEAM